MISSKRPQTKGSFPIQPQQPVIWERDELSITRFDPASRMSHVSKWKVKNLNDPQQCKNCDWDVCIKVSLDEVEALRAIYDVDFRTISEEQRVFSITVRSGAVGDTRLCLDLLVCTRACYPCIIF